MLQKKIFQIINHTRKEIAYTDIPSAYKHFTKPGETYCILVGKAQLDHSSYLNKGYKVVTGYDQKKAA
jgi:hypothetical protein